MEHALSLRLHRVSIKWAWQKVMTSWKSTWYYYDPMHSYCKRLCITRFCFRLPFPKSAWFKLAASLSFSPCKSLCLVMFHDGVALDTKWGGGCIDCVRLHRLHIFGSKATTCQSA